MNFWEHPLFLLFASTVLPILLAVLSHRRSITSDKLAERATVASNQIATLKLAHDTLTSLMANLREDNTNWRESDRAEREDRRLSEKDLREQIRQCALRVSEGVVELERTELERDELAVENRRLKEELSKRGK